MNSKPLVLLDTSIQIERLLGATRQRHALEQHLATASCHFVTSAYAFMEFQRAVVAEPAASIWTIDADFQPIAQALGLSLYRPAFN